jgi:histidinol phosphatase-like PHP family hydrolase
VTITSDWHIHTRNSLDGASMRIADLITDAREKGLRDFGVTDHLNTPCNLPDITASRSEYLGCSPGPRFHFGVEASCVSQWELDEIASGRHGIQEWGLRSGGPPGADPAICLTAQDIATCGIEYVVAGVHWPLYVPMERDAVIHDYHRQNMFLVRHPLVDIVAHPWWWTGGWASDDGRFATDPWLDDFGKVPQSMHDEFAAAAVGHDTVVECNIHAMLLNSAYPESFAGQYLEYLAGLKQLGVKLSVGSDCHAEHYTTNLDKATEMLGSVGITDADLWCLPARRE